MKREAAINKRVALAQLPPTLVLHLNRFFLDLDTFSTVKLNTAFEFPRRLNVEEYTKEGLAWREGNCCVTVLVNKPPHNVMRFSVKACTSQMHMLGSSH